MDDLFHLRHFTTGEYNKNRTFLSDEDYSLALDVFVLLLKRSVQPQKDWWFLGGRMQAGEEPHVTAARHVRREAGVDLAPQRFRAVCHSSYLWQFRKQAPAGKSGQLQLLGTAGQDSRRGNGTADIAVVFSVDVTPQEKADIRLDMNEYETFCWCDVQEVIDNAMYHPALRRAALHLQMRDKWDSMAAAVSAPPGTAQQGDAEGQDARIAGFARELIALQAAALALPSHVPLPPEQNT
ncbi:hypothetical protein QJQ45_026763 [Haematococcus lacustris]|nr:hypothetical protein QJQ45_026763 [Haematococcus lacustris]